jgi:hypothetical protein
MIKSAWQQLQLEAISSSANWARQRGIALRAQPRTPSICSSYPLLRKHGHPLARAPHHLPVRRTTMTSLRWAQFRPLPKKNQHLHS